MKKLFIGALIALTLFNTFSSPIEAKSKTKNETKIEEIQEEKKEDKKEDKKKDKKKNKKNKKDKKKEEEKAELTPEEKIKKFSKKICGKKNYRNSMYFPSADPSVCDGCITIDSDFHDNFTNEYINMSECENAFDLAKAVFTDDTFKDINEVRYCVYAKYVDKFGNEDEHIAIKIFITRDTFSKFNLDSENADLLYQNLPDVADYYSTDFK